MNDYTKYCLFITVIFLVSAIINFNFYNKYSECPYDNSIFPYFLFLGIVNISLTFSAFSLASLLFYLSNVFPVDLDAPSLFLRLLGRPIRILPLVLKILHVLRIVLLIVVCALAPSNSSISLEFLLIDQTLLSETCKAAELQKLRQDNFENNLRFTVILESCSVVFVIFGCGLLRQFVFVDNLIYEPNRKEAGRIRRFCCKQIGP